MIQTYLFKTMTVLKVLYLKLMRAEIITHAVFWTVIKEVKSCTAIYMRILLTFIYFIFNYKSSHFNFIITLNLSVKLKMTLVTGVILYFTYTG